jgi:hypothetical protein
MIGDLTDKRVRNSNDTAFFYDVQCVPLVNVTKCIFSFLPGFYSVTGIWESTETWQNTPWNGIFIHFVCGVSFETSLTYRRVGLCNEHCFMG